MGTAAARCDSIAGLVSRAFCWLLLSGLVLGWGTPVGAVVEYDLIVVEAFSGSIPECYLRDINEVNRACGTATSGSFYDGFHWSESAGKVAIPLIWAEDINNLDQIVGDAILHDFISGISTPVPGLNDTYATIYLHGLNDDGIAVGHAKGPGSDSDGVNRVPIVWDEAGGTVSINVFGARELLRISNDGVAVGNIRLSAGDSEAFVYDVATGATVLLHDLLSPSGAGTSEAVDVNENGVVLGEGWNDTAYRGFLWSEAGGFTFLPGLNGGETMRVHPRCVNDLDQVVGYALDGVTADWRAFIWDDANGMRDLNDLTDVSNGFILDRALAINNQGWIVGDGHFGPGFGAPLGFALVPRETVSTAEVVAPGQNRLLRVKSGAAHAGGPVTLEFIVRESGPVRLGVFDASGRRVASILHEHRQAGEYALTWAGRDAISRLLPSGVYFVRLETVAGNDTRSIVRVR